MAAEAPRSVDKRFEDCMGEIKKAVEQLSPVARKMLVDSLMIELRAMPKAWRTELPGT